jgi:hypothetical protein
VVILIVQDVSIAVFDIKSDSPIATHPNGPFTFSAAFQTMKPEARDIHILDRRSGFKGG